MKKEILRKAVLRLQYSFCDFITEKGNRIGYSKDTK